MRATLIYNSKAGNVDRHSVEVLEDALRTVGFSPVYEATSSEHDLDPILEDVEGLVVAAGGDGTVRAVATRLIGKNASLCIVPMGTANNIGRALGIRGTPREILLEMESPKKRPFDIGYVRGPWGEDYFLEAMGFGLYADVLMDYDPKEGKSFVRSVTSIFETLNEYEAKNCHLNLDGRLHNGPFLLVEVLNTEAMGPRLKLAPGANASDGLLDVVMVREDARVNMIAYLNGLLSERLEKLPSVDHQQGRVLSFGLNGFPVHIDGEVRPEKIPASAEHEPAKGARPPSQHPTDNLVHIEVVPSALEVWLPGDPKVIEDDAEADAPDAAHPQEA